MRVLQLIDSLQVGGAERTAVNYANLLVKEIDRSFLCATRLEGPLRKTINKDVGYLYLKRKFKIDFKALKVLVKFVKTNQITIIHAHGTSFFFATLLKLFNKKLEIVWHDHNGIRIKSDKNQHKFLKYCSYFFNKIITVNNDLKKWAENYLHTNKVYCLSNFSDLKQEKEKTVLKGVEGKRIVCLANLREPKNHIYLLKAFSIVVNLVDQWSLHLIGEDFNDNYSNEIKQFIKDNNLNHHVFLYGLRTDVENILLQCDIGVLSSKSEGLPLSIIEYGLSSLAVVCTNVGDCNKVVSNKNEGILVELNAVEEYSNALLNFIKNKDKRILAGKLLNEKVTKDFNKENLIEELISIYKK